MFTIAVFWSGLAIAFGCFVVFVGARAIRRNEKFRGVVLIVGGLLSLFLGVSELV